MGFSVDTVVQVTVDPAPSRMSVQLQGTAGYVCLLPITSTVFCVILSISSRVPVKLHPVGATLKPWISVREMPVKSVSALRSKERLPRDELRDGDCFQNLALVVSDIEGDRA